MQAMSGDLQEILVSKFQAGASGFRGLVEIENSPDAMISDFVPEGAGPTSQDIFGACYHHGLYYPSTKQPGSYESTPLYTHTSYSYSFSGCYSHDGIDYFGVLQPGPANQDAAWPSDLFFGCDDSVTLTGGSFAGRWSWDLNALGTPWVTAWSVGSTGAEINPGCWNHISLEYSTNGTDWTTADSFDATGNASYPGVRHITPGHYRYWSIHIECGNTGTGTFFARVDCLMLWGGHIGPVPIQVSRITIDKSLQTDADGLEVECQLAPEDEAMWSQWLPLCKPDKKIWVHQWYGDAANKIQTFYGFLDKPDENRDPKSRTITLTARDWMKNALVQSAIVNYPQGATDEGAVRDPSNFVYLNMQVSDIVLDLLTHCQFVSTHVTTTDYVVGDFEVTDGTSFAAAFSQLAALVGFQSFADEQGGYHFEPIAIGSPAYTFTSGVDMVSLERASDDFDLATRVKVVGKDAAGADVVQIAIAGAGVVGIPEPSGITGPVEGALNNPIRRIIVRDSSISTTDQAATTASAQLAKQDGFRYVDDAGIVGNPGLQKGDTIQIIEPVMGEASLWIADSYRTEMTATPGGAGTYLGLLGLTLVD